MLLLDLNMPGPDPSDTVSYLHRHCPRLKIVVLTAYDDDGYVHTLMRVGVEGYILKEEGLEAIPDAVRSVMRGERWISQTVLNKLHRHKRQRRQLDPSYLSPRERDILRLIGQGWNNTRIVAELGLAEQTIRNYTSRIYEKLAVPSREDAAQWALDHWDELNSEQSDAPKERKTGR